MKINVTLWQWEALSIDAAYRASYIFVTPTIQYKPAVNRSTDM